MGHAPDMARKLRLQYPGAFYHLMSRGDRRELVFLEDADRALFVSTLGEACAKTDWQVHAYCLMKNHFHLVVETPSANLAAGMQWDRGNPSTGGSRNTETQNVDMLGTDPFMFQGITITFPVDFDKEDGNWTIYSF